jgi:hypothetical protein
MKVALARVHFGEQMRVDLNDVTSPGRAHQDYDWTSSICVRSDSEGI